MKSLLFLFLVTLFAPADTVSEFSRQAYVQMATHDSIRVIWRSRKDMKPRVVYGHSVEDLSLTVPAGQILTRLHPSLGEANSLFKDTPVDTRQFEATLTKLKAASTYYYAIYDGDTRLTPADNSYRFKTNPVPGTDTPVYFWVVGDSGTAGKAQAQVHEAMVKHNAAAGRSLDFYVHVGDMAYGSGTNKEFSDRFFNMYEPTLRNVVCWPSMGNHEGKTSKGATGVGPYYDAYICPTQAEAGGLASGKEAFYSFDFGKTHFICLDSHDLDRRPTGEMAQWLKADLEKTQAEFLVAYFHHPPYTKGSHDSDKEGQLIEMREYIMPILESGGVDLVFTGHSHIYERSMLIDGAYDTPSIAKGVILDDRDGDPNGEGPYKKSQGLNPNNGTVSVTTGHGGTTNRRSGTHPLMRRIILDNGSCLITIKGDTITGEMLNLNGEIRDTFAIHKNGTVEHAPIIDPWQPEPHKPSQKKTSLVAPKDATELVAKNAEWSYLGGSHPSGDPTDWAAPKHDVSDWKVGKAGFGYGDNDDTTIINMRDKFTTLYIRREFNLPKGATLNKLGLSVSYDDSFIAYINGHEVHRQGVDKEQGASADGFTNHNANNTFEYFPLKGISKILKPGGKNVIAIEGHNVNLKSSDFTLHPRLLLGK
ncbi:MAG: metallophosphoesterase family protein [Akkermansiaceae bacterium]|tara:strand:- start:144 stop:2084 length:1941 start_codon:yes stop_codon:yes gene_type:complete